MPIGDEIKTIRQFSGNTVSETVSTFEKDCLGLSAPAIIKMLNEKSIDRSLLSAAFAVKAASAQIDVIIHAVGILYCLPFILKDEEEVQGISLGAGSGQGDFDLETSERIAEFKFIRWQTSGNAVRKKSLFEDYVKLAISSLDKEKFIYLPDCTIALRFLMGRSNPLRLLDKNRRLYDVYRETFNETYRHVGDFHRAQSEEIQIVDLLHVVPPLRGIIK